MEECKKKKFQTQTQRLKKNSSYPLNHPHREKITSWDRHLHSASQSDTRPSQIYTLQLVFACAILKQKSINTH